MAKIKQILSREILDSKGDPTLETTVILTDGAVGIASVPTGTSVGKYEAFDLLDNDPKRYAGKGVLNATAVIEKVISPILAGQEASNQQQIDKIMIQADGTPNKQKFGGNTTLSVSIAVAKAAAKSSVLPLFLYLRQFLGKDNADLKMPVPCFNILNGGKHADGNVDFQEFLVIPASLRKFSEALELGSNVYFALKQVLEENNLSTLTGLGGGFSPKVSGNQDAFLLVKQAIEKADLKVGYDMFIGMDAASDNFLQDNKYVIKDKSSAMSAKDLIAFYQNLNNQYHLLYLEDGISQDDWDGWKDLYSAMSNQTLIVGDVLTASNPTRLQEALQKKTISGVNVKPSQIGTVIESLAVAEITKQAGLKLVVSNRSGETNDDFIADFAVAASADYVKFGPPVRGERVSKYNRLLSIENQLNTL